MPVFIDLTGHTYGRLTVLKRVPNRSHSLYPRTIWLCRCECGRLVRVATGQMRSGKTRSCGCYKRDQTIKAKTTHGATRNRQTAPEYLAWQGMKSRTSNKNCAQWKDYGGRGVTMWPEWRRDFLAFFNHIGPKPSPHHSIDRYPNRDGNYEPGNIRWATATEQNNNRRSNRYVTHNGQTKTLKQWSQQARVGYEAFKHRLNIGQPIERALTAKPATELKQLTYAGETMTIRAWENRLLLAHGTLKARREMGWSLERALSTPKIDPARLVTFKGNTKTIREWGKIFNLSPMTMNTRLRKGWTLAEVFRPVHVETLTFDGHTRTISEWATVLQIDRECLRQRLKKGWSLKRALTEPLRVTKLTRHV